MPPCIRVSGPVPVICLIRLWMPIMPRSWENGEGEWPEAGCSSGNARWGFPASCNTLMCWSEEGNIRDGTDLHHAIEFIFGSVQAIKWCRVINIITDNTENLVSLIFSARLNRIEWQGQMIWTDRTGYLLVSVSQKVQNSIGVISSRDRAEWRDCAVGAGVW